MQITRYILCHIIVLISYVSRTCLKLSFICITLFNAYICCDRFGPLYWIRLLYTCCKNWNWREAFKRTSPCQHWREVKSRNIREVMQYLRGSTMRHVHLVLPTALPMKLRRSDWKGRQPTVPHQPTKVSQVSSTHPPSYNGYFFVPEYHVNLLIWCFNCSVKNNEMVFTKFLCSSAYKFSYRI